MSGEPETTDLMADERVRRLIMSVQQVLGADPGEEDWDEMQEAVMAIVDPNATPMEIPFYEP